MNTATIEVAFVNPPKEGRKMGDVKDTDGQYWKVWPDKLSQFHQGQRYDIEYTTSEYNGKPFSTIKKFTPVGGDSPKTAIAPQKATVGSTQAKEMFAMGTIGRCLQGSGTYPDGATLEGWIRDAFQAWDNASKPKQKSIQEELDDEIPF